MSFELLQARLVANLRRRLESGESTERGLARLSGLSQPHLHNVLKGIRSLSPQSADQILSRLRLSVLDLFDPAEIAEHAERRELASLRYREIPLLEGHIGPGHPFAAEPSPGDFFPFPSAEVTLLVHPAVARLAEDPVMHNLFRAGDLALLDLSEARREHPAPQSYFVIDRGSSSLIRHAQRQGPGLYLFADHAETWSYISLADRNILEVVRARVFWIGRYLEPFPVVARPTEEAR